MPTLPVYIRVDDLDKWKSLPNKSEFIHNALNREGFWGKGLPPSEPLQPIINKLKPIKTKEDVVPAIKRIFPEAKVKPLYRDEKNKKL